MEMVVDSYIVAALRNDSLLPRLDGIQHSPREIMAHSTCSLATAIRRSFSFPVSRGLPGSYQVDYFKANFCNANPPKSTSKYYQILPAAKWLLIDNISRNNITVSSSQYFKLLIARFTILDTHWKWIECNARTKKV
jgi:hypothetical protein